MNKSYLNIANNLTSDHALTSLNILVLNLYHKVEFQFSIVTYNLLNKCYSKNNCYNNHATPYSNNPYNLDEDNDEYFKRKMIQFNEIISNFEDIFLCQEVDFLFTSKLKKEFYAKIENRSIAVIQYIVRPDHNNLQRKQRPLVTLYNSEKFSLLEYGPCLLHNDIYHGKYVILESKSNPQIKLYIINMHLDYNFNHMEEIRQIISNAITLNYIVVIGGDSNDETLRYNDYLIRDYDLPNNLGDNNKGEIADHIYVSEKVKIIKNPDGFFTGSPSNYYLKMNEHRSKFFKQVDKNKFEIVDKINDKFFINLPGKEFIKYENIFKSFDNKIFKSSSYDKINIIFTEFENTFNLLQNHIKQDFFTEELFPNISNQIKLKNFINEKNFSLSLVFLKISKEKKYSDNFKYELLFKNYEEKIKFQQLLKLTEDEDLSKNNILRLNVETLNIFNFNLGNV